ncbi:hypothetical protein Rhow_004599 [Rhodococcus wratislaviensis]|uniref:Uncharacterized protein n=1 Tax=Rhodococcus wratislaviensis TaxID=44752 RepID=A0A402CBI3_RHOWR|nr:hypothetical protein [Rhodococcus wratislaviensis]GCE40956.1 hypothetical protein Rhow_004599 [Rhodococcus wratislaviensis]
MILAEAAADSQWWENALTPIGYIIAAAIAAGVAVRLARKTPHENLKALTDIYVELPSAVDERAVIEKAIQQELDKLEALSKARDKPGFQGRLEYFYQRAQWSWWSWVIILTFAAYFVYQSFWGSLAP